MLESVDPASRSRVPSLTRNGPLMARPVRCSGIAKARSGGIPFYCGPLVGERVTGIEPA